MNTKETVTEPYADISINDVTLRDGEQAPGNSMSTEQKILIARQLVKMGVNGIEAGFAIASKGDFESVRQIAYEVGNIKLPNKDAYPRISSLARLNMGDIERATEAVRGAPNPGLHTFISTSEIQSVKFGDAIRRKGGTPGSMRDLVDKVIVPGIEEGMSYIRKTNPNIIIQFSPEDWTRTDEHVSDDVILAAAANGTKVINLPDTVGIGIPRIIGKRVKHVRKVLDENGYNDVVISWHGHNDTGLGIANAMEALYGGARQFEPTILGIGERTGNFSFEGFVAAMDASIAEHEEIIGMKIMDGLVRGELMNTARLVSNIIEMPIPREHPIAGENAFAHESGIHVHGQLLDNLYEVLEPKKYGTESKNVIGKHSGWHGLRDEFNRLNVPYDEKDRNDFTSALADSADRTMRRKGFSTDELMQSVYYPTVERITGGTYVKDIVEIESQDGCICVRIITREGTDVIGKASNPAMSIIDAIVQGMKCIIPNVNIPANGFSVKTMGTDSSAVARARVTIHNDQTVTRSADDSNTSRAEQKALIAAFNSLYAIDEYVKRMQKEVQA
ncbi:MAG: hypothetical protein O3A80_04230 [bacterium]|nr:hypothetical protein [bacterium]